MVIACCFDGAALLPQPRPLLRGQRQRWPASDKASTASWRLPSSTSPCSDQRLLRARARRAPPIAFGGLRLDPAAWVCAAGPEQCVGLSGLSCRIPPRRCLLIAANSAPNEQPGSGVEESLTPQRATGLRRSLSNSGCAQRAHEHGMRVPPSATGLGQCLRPPPGSPESHRPLRFPRDGRPSSGMMLRQENFRSPRRRR